MKRWTALAAAVTLLAPIAASAQAASPVSCLGAGDLAPAHRSLFVSATIGGATLDFTPCVRGTGKVHTFSANYVLAGVSQGTVSGTFDEDPFINFALATTNLAAGPTSFQFTFSTPIVPGLYTNATSSLSGSLTAGQVPATLTNIPGSPSGTIPFLRGNGTLNGVPTSPGLGVFTVGNLGVDVGFGPCSTPGSSVNCPASPAAAATAFAPTFYNDLDAIISYQQGGQLSQAAFTGRVEIFSSTVPEPATLSLLATGAAILGLAGLARRRRG